LESKPTRWPRQANKNGDRYNLVAPDESALMTQLELADMIRGFFPVRARQRIVDPEATGLRSQHSLCSKRGLNFVRQGYGIGDHYRDGAYGGSKKTGAVLEKCITQLKLNPHGIEHTVLDTCAHQPCAQCSNNLRLTTTTRRLQRSSSGPEIVVTEVTRFI
jgi:hypothetical protein